MQNFYIEVEKADKQLKRLSLLYNNQRSILSKDSEQIVKIMVDMTSDF